MLIAREKRKSNVAEYILYMWQVEDMLRAMQMDIELVNRNVVSQFGGMMRHGRRSAIGMTT